MNQIMFHAQSKDSENYVTFSNRKSYAIIDLPPRCTKILITIIYAILVFSY